MMRWVASGGASQAGTLAERRSRSSQLRGMYAKAAILLAALLVPAGSASEQQHQGHMRGGGSEEGEVRWRMPPMGKMPMMPGLENTMPPADPFLAGTGIDPNMFPEAIPAEVVDMADGDTLELEAALVRRTINGKTFVMYGYNGQYPGPLIKAEQGSTIIVHFKSAIEMPTTVHWHGVRLDNRFDGVPTITQAPVARGESFTYEVHFPDAGVYWYHPHIRLDIQQDLGLYGNLLVAPREAGYYSPVNREEVLLLDDILMDGMGLIPWGRDVPTHTLMGRFGNVMLVNGTTDYDLSVKRGEVVRFFLTNVANSRIFNVTFGGAPIKIVASDVSKFEREEWVQSVVIAPAERYVVEVRFPTPGEVEIENTIQAIDHFRGQFYPHVDHLGTVEVANEPVAEDYGESFERLRENDDVRRDIDAFRPYFDKPPDHSLELTLRVRDLPLPIVQSLEFEKGIYAPPMEWNDTMPMMNWLATGGQVFWLLHEPDTDRENMEIHWDFDVGDVAKIRIFNDPMTIHPMNHPIHLHGQRFLVLEMDGVPNPNLVWKDTTMVPVGSTVDILVDMSNPGDWVLHCNITEHLHAGMMLSFSVWDEEVKNQGIVGRGVR
ncbi:MAG: multicopper oxidase family protein [Acidobacteriota bacterium]